MEINEVEKIQELIKKAELQNAKNQGYIDSIKKNWKKEYGTDDIEEIKKRMNELKDEVKKSDERMEKLYNDLISSYDWDSLAEELED